jgi:hypothetical protein
VTFGSHRSLRQNSYLSLLSLETSGLFALISFLVQLDGCGRGI